MSHQDDQASPEPRRRTSRGLPMLESIRIASPCTARWEDMRGDDRIRFCGSCEKHVYNLSAMSAGEAEALLTEGKDSICVRLYRRADGTVLTEDCPVGARKKRIRRTLAAAAGAGALAAAASAAYGMVARPTMGAVAVYDPPIMGSVAVSPPSAPVVERGAPTAVAPTTATPSPTFHAFMGAPSLAKP